MIERDKKILKIVDVFYTYCVYVGGKHIKVETKLENEVFHVRVESDFEEENLEEIKSLDEKLNKPKDPAMEAMYWNVIGNTEFQDDNDIYVVGSMVDTAKIKIEGNHFEVDITRTY